MGLLLEEGSYPEADPDGGEGGSSPGQILIPNFLIIEVNGFCLTTSSHKSNFHANHAHHIHHAQNFSVELLLGRW